MLKKEKTLGLLLEQKLLPLFYHDDAGTSLSVLQALYDAGLRVVEYTNRGEAALANFKILRKEVGIKMPGMSLGVGTIKSRKQARKFLDAGAGFIVCPSMNEEVGKLVVEEKVLWVPGCMTPTEIASAENAGAQVVKIFPGSLLGPDYIKAIKEVFPTMQFLVTGGVDAEEKNLNDWFGAGVVAVGMGSRLVTKDLILNKDFEGIKVNAQRAIELIKICSAGK